jgi:acyl-CoA synthetase (AMP-forming)/AMP-acid ligase II
LKRQNKINIWGTFTDNARQFAELDCIWYSDPATNPPTVHTFSWTQAYQYACQYAQWFLSAGVQPGDCVGFYLQNSPDFVLGWMGLLAIGCYPAFINYNLVGGALVHCTKIAECRMLLVDEDIQDRVIENEELKAMGVKIQVVDEKFREQIRSLEPSVPDEKFTKDANERTRLALRYTSGTTGKKPLTEDGLSYSLI